MAKSRFFRVAVEGATVDGRTIDRKWLEEMAASYNRQTYAARVNLEHIRGASPLSNQTPFGSYGDVLALKVEEITLSIGGQDQKRLALFAEIEALEPLVALVAAGQKLYTSIEINPSFADTGKAYLMGLAVTDSPASLGTEMLEFSAKMGANSPLAARKQQPGNFFSVASEAAIDLVDPDQADPTGILAAIKGAFARFTPAADGGAQNPPGGPAANNGQPQGQPPAHGGTDTGHSASGGDFAAIGLMIGQMAGAIDKLATANAAQLSTIGARIDKIEALQANSVAPGQNHRQLAVALTNGSVETDC